MVTRLKADLKQLFPKKKIQKEPQKRIPKKRGKESSKATGKRCIPDLNMILLMM